MSPDHQVLHFSHPKTALVLSGGAAHCAYQAGVLKGIATIMSPKPLKFPFEILCGVSAGARRTLRRRPYYGIFGHSSFLSIGKGRTEIPCRMLKFLIGGLGPNSEGRDLISYLLFEPAYSKRLIDLGVSDALNESENILKFCSR